MINSLPPGMILILGGLLLSRLRGRIQQITLVALPLLSAAHLLALPNELLIELTLFDFTLTPIRIDRLSLVWSYVLHIAAFVSALYAVHVRDTTQHVAALVYAGAAIAAVFAGDLITLFVYWELTAVSSVFLIWARRSARAYRAGMRYLVIQVGSGVLLLSGILLHYRDQGTLDFNSFTELGLTSPGPLLILIAFGIKCAFPLLHNWLQDAYPEATESGTVFLSAFTTKLAVYALARGFAGTEILIVIGATMAVFPAFFAVIENDLRRVLAYSLNVQQGYMVVGVGLGTELALNGTAAHAIACILYTCLLFMSMGAVLFRTGTVNCSELGGLYKSMPWTAGLCIVGAASISAFPFFSSFVTKSMILTAAAEEGHVITWLILLSASAGVFLHSGIKIPYFAFFAHDSGKRVKEAPWNMLIAMGATAALCIGIGVFPGALYRILPFHPNYHAYSVSHVMTQYQILLFSALAFTILIRMGSYPPEQRSLNLDTDWVYRRLFPSLIRTTYPLAVSCRRKADVALDAIRVRVGALLSTGFGPTALFSRTWSTSGMVLWASLFLTIYLLVYYLH